MVDQDELAARSCLQQTQAATENLRLRAACKMHAHKNDTT
jgi:hypothetical protein